VNLAASPESEISALISVTLANDGYDDADPNLKHASSLTDHRAGAIASAGDDLTKYARVTYLRNNPDE
jgi:hypothetical protein